LHYLPHQNHQRETLPLRSCTFPCFAVYPYINEIILLETLYEDQSSAINYPAIRDDLLQFGTIAPAVVRAFAWKNGAVEGNKKPKISHYFTAFFVAPTVLVTARHNLFDKDGNRMQNIFFTTERGILEARDIFFPVAILYEPEEAFKVTEYMKHDFVLLTVKDYKHPMFLSPSTVIPTVGDLIVTMQYNGMIDNAWYAQQKLLTSHIQHKLERINELLNTNDESISIGRVAEIRPTTILYAVSTTPGASGAPGFILKPGSKQTFEFCSIHGGGVNGEAHNHGMLAMDPTFMTAYNQFVVPELA